MGLMPALFFLTYDLHYYVLATQAATRNGRIDRTSIRSCRPVVRAWLLRTITPTGARLGQAIRAGPKTADQTAAVVRFANAKLYSKIAN